ncbi:MAG: type II toxin-antitoxin system RelE/ParE family toxin [Haliscomenobacteraceae bacterium CHB4]|nr:type II toxin-antitoxin system RelE/ParE family toxin [Haliscomenobacteraceae bacterium CHB4]
MVEIDITGRALKDIDEIAEYHAHFSENAARTYIKRIYAAIDLLRSFPNLGKVSPELDYPKVREILADPYKIYYHVVSEKLIRIITINLSGLPLDFEKLKPN